MLNLIIYDKKLNYDGSQLTPHFILKTTGIYGNSIFASRGSCNISFKSMVDLEDVLNNDSIKSNDMLHFIIEIFDLDIKHAVMLQRLFVCIIKETIEEMSKHKLTRKGDDLYLKDSKLNISIATKSAVSILIHIGINICSKDTPVKTISFHDLKINWTSARDIIMHKFKDEFEDIYKAISKVKPV